MRKTLEVLLKTLARLTLKRYQPKIIGITGSMGKTSTKEAVFCVLNNHFRVRRNIKNYNNELGLPLTVLGLQSGGRSPLRWGWNLSTALWRLVFHSKKYPEILILEMAADKPGDLKYLTKIARPDIAVVTGVGEIPVHVEFFKGPKAVAREKSTLVKVLNKTGFAVLNADDPLVLGMKSKTKAKAITFGFSKDADVLAEELDYSYSLSEEELLGIRFKINSEGKVVPFRLRGTLGAHQLYAALAAVAVGRILGMNLVEISNALLEYQGPAGRMKLLGGVKQAFVIDDTYNASPEATKKALDVLREIPVEGKKIAVLGDMLELGDYTQKAHREIGRRAFKSADIFVAVGPRMKIAFAEAKAIGFAKDNLYFFETSNDAKKKVEELMDPEDLVLVKGSQSMRMEKVVEEIMAEPGRAPELLVRQEGEWKLRR